MELIIGIIVFLIGLCIGSFVNMAVYRYAAKNKLKQNPPLAPPLTRRGIKINSDRSYCDFCGKQLHLYENIPIVSWILQGGKSRCCGRSLPYSYPVVELVTGILFVGQLVILNGVKDLGIYSIDSSLALRMTTLVLSLIIIGTMVFSAVVDVKYMILPDEATLILVVGAIGLLLLGRHMGLPLQSYVLTALAATGFLGLLYLITKGKGMGLGDVKLAFFMGLLLGPIQTVVAFYVAFIVGAMAGIALITLKKKKRRSAIAFGPFLFVGTLAAWWWGEEILKIFNLQF